MNAFLKQISSAVRTHLASFASVIGKPLNPHINGSSILYTQVQDNLNLPNFPRHKNNIQQTIMINHFGTIYT
jgi:hypothetical protein